MSFSYLRSGEGLIALAIEIYFGILSMHWVLNIFLMKGRIILSYLSRFNIKNVNDDNIFLTVF